MARDDAPGLERGLRDRVIARLGLPQAPAADARGLRALYQAWCTHVPFDNVRKMTALLGGGNSPLPAMAGADFLESWLTDGAGGTCWPTSNALCELACSLGFAARRITASMHDVGVGNHGSVRINLDGGEWLVDSSMLTNAPLPLTRDLYMHDDPVCAVEVEPVDGTHIVWWECPPSTAHLPCRLMDDSVGYTHYAAAYEASRVRSPFNQRLFARRNRPGAVVLLAGHTCYVKSAEGLRARELAPDEVKQILREDIGLAEDLIEQWARVGGLQATFETPPGPQPPPLTRQPPSRRGTTA